ncbi:glucose 1-dehydrogenase [Pseudosporangium ferrugineum]|uniref:glucose 1-dehydrogenase n=1 Tax=Pseudosporangium ferrugineum TaxID=439699 RepID=UPI000D057947|nr:glucose 1-dehydrogenase [Pseudosporangium ferrugineum]
MRDFTGRTVIVTGAGSGIGRATAVLLATEGAELTLVDVDEQGLAGTGDELEKASPGSRALLVTADVSREEEVAGYVRATMETFGRIDGVVNNAGIEGKHGLTEDYGTEELDRVIGVNLVGVHLGMRHTLKIMREQRRGAIVNMASLAGIRGVAQRAGYVAAKHGVIGLTRSAALEYGRFGIRVNAIAPGGVLTPLVERAMREAGGDNWRELADAAGTPMGRLGAPEDIAAPVAFLLSPEAAFINGTVLTIDGGQSTAAF